MQITERLSWYELAPVKRARTGKVIKPKTGLIFVPGARVDARAYAHILRPLAEAGYLVAVLKEPFGFALIQPDHAETVIDLHPEIAYWAIGGHSLGGGDGGGVRRLQRAGQRPGAVRLLSGQSGSDAST